MFKKELSKVDGGRVYLSPDVRLDLEARERWPGGAARAHPSNLEVSKRVRPILLQPGEEHQVQVDLTDLIRMEPDDVYGAQYTVKLSVKKRRPARIHVSIRKPLKESR